MSQVKCKKCGSDSEGLEHAPLPGDVGKQILQATCKSCWQGWMGEQVKMINEMGLTPVNPQHYELLVTQMKNYLGLAEG